MGFILKALSFSRDRSRRLRYRCHSPEDGCIAHMTATVTIERFHAPTADPDAVHAVIDRDGAVILEGLLSGEVVARINGEVGPVLDAADPDAELFNPIMKAFHGPLTKQVAG